MPPHPVQRRKKLIEVAIPLEAINAASAREKNAPPRIDLVRLTVPQFRNAVADIVAGFKGNVGWSSERGLKGEYYKSRNYRKDDLVLERVDPVIDFDKIQKVQKYKKYVRALFCQYCH